MLTLGNFLVLDQRRLVDPVRKIAIQNGRFNLEDCFHDFKVYYDPEIDVDHLWQKLSHDEAKRIAPNTVASSEDVLIPFSSRSKITVLMVSFKESWEGDMLIIKFSGDEKSFFLDRKYFEDKSVSTVSGDTNTFIEEIIEKIFEWYGTKSVSPANFHMKEVRLVMDESYARHLPSRKGQTFVKDESGHVILGQREIV